MIRRAAFVVALLVVLPARAQEGRDPLAPAEPPWPEAPALAPDGRDPLTGEAAPPVRRAPAEEFPPPADPDAKVDRELYEALLRALEEERRAREAPPPLPQEEALPPAERFGFTWDVELTWFSRVEAQTNDSLEAGLWDAGREGMSVALGYRLGAWWRPHRRFALAAQFMHLPRARDDRFVREGDFAGGAVQDVRLELRLATLQVTARAVHGPTFQLELGAGAGYLFSRFSFDDRDADPADDLTPEERVRIELPLALGSVRATFLPLPWLELALGLTAGGYAKANDRNGVVAEASASASFRITAQLRLGVAWRVLGFQAVDDSERQPQYNSKKPLIEGLGQGLALRLELRF